MKYILPYLRYFRKVTGSIAFLPSVISVLFVFFGTTFLYLEQQYPLTPLAEKLNFAIVKDTNTARNIIGILIGGIISLMVFSFSMVMVVLSQALSSLSPRIIPGLISDKRHQSVLGVYLGSLLYLLLVMINLRGEKYSVEIPLNVLGAIVIGIICLIFFTYFIHTISQGIQVEVILENIHYKTKRQVMRLEEFDEVKEVKDDYPEDYQLLVSSREGYFNGVNQRQLISLCEKHECQLFIIIRHGSYVYYDMPIAYVSKRLPDETLRDRFTEQFFMDNSITETHYFYGLKYITEIGVKALSPGINDPGTAMKAINFLTVLLQLKMTRPDRNFYTNEEGEAIIFFKPLDFATLLYHFYAPFKTYGNKDINVMLNMLKAFLNFVKVDQDRRLYVETLHDQVLSIREYMDALANNELDKKICNTLINEVNAQHYFPKPIAYLPQNK